MIVSEMNTQECRMHLATSRVGHLACVTNGMPYVVPISFVYENSHIYSFSLIGRKVWGNARTSPGLPRGRRDPQPSQLVECHCLRPLRRTFRNGPTAE
ncbi:MAG: hypothetical protein EOR43_01920 [Mesorhizobium sp.]|nr:MAG: hypothetical protein EOR43_01920 [Mesorhizobium sp.]RWK36403.1 MAG: hypothetical protein EOR44_02510 [Mesorhizobium sp.]